VDPEIIALSGLQEFYISEGCHIVELSNTENDPSVSIARARVKPGVTTKWHKLNHTVERYVVVGGGGLVEIGDIEPSQLNVGDCVLIPEGCRQRITNNGDSDLVFLAICSPRFVAENYEEI
jgi:mannose-6-phosphate isomerase-like protein (cupin superfamily)